MRRPHAVRHARARSAPHPLVAAASLVALALLGAACGGSTPADAEDAAPPSTETTEVPTTSAPTTPGLANEELVTARYREFLEVVVAATNSLEDAAALDEVATGLALAKGREIVADRRSSRTRLAAPSTDAIGLSITGIDDSADDLRATFCLVDGVEVRAIDGDVVLNDMVVASDVAVAFEKQAGDWKVARVEFLSRSEGARACVGY
jgi:hypothetical protein